jgi:hypothetical protein
LIAGGCTNLHIRTCSKPVMSSCMNLKCTLSVTSLNSPLRSPRASVRDDEPTPVSRIGPSRSHHRLPPQGRARTRSASNRHKQYSMCRHGAVISSWSLFAGSRVKTHLTMDRGMCVLRQALKKARQGRYGPANLRWPSPSQVQSISTVSSLLEKAHHAQLPAVNIWVGVVLLIKLIVSLARIGWECIYGARKTHMHHTTKRCP